jgi:hypothetical protein
VQPAPVVAAAPAVSQPAASQAAPSNVTVSPAYAKATSAPSLKNAKRDDARDLLDQVPSGLRKRFGF